MGFPTWGELAMLGSALLFLLTYGVTVGVQMWRSRRLTIPQLALSLLVGFVASFLCFFILAAALVRKVA
jgi:hypothetical protein